MAYEDLLPQPQHLPPRRRFSDEFRREAVQMLLDGHTASDVADRLGLSGPGLLYRWKAQHLRRSGPVAAALDDRVQHLEGLFPRSFSGTLIPDHDPLRTSGRTPCDPSTSRPTT